MKTVQDAMSELLLSFGFTRMSEDVKTETDPETLRKYARIIVKQTPEKDRSRVANNFRTLGVM